MVSLSSLSMRFIPIMLLLSFTNVYCMQEQEKLDDEKLIKELWTACYNNDSNSVAQLCSKEINVNRFFKKTTPLMITLLNGNKEAADILLSYGANPNLANDDNMTPIEWLLKSINATDQKKFEIMCSLLKHNVDYHQPLSTYQTPLDYAELMGYNAIVLLLISKALQV